MRAMVRLLEVECVFNLLPDDVLLCILCAVLRTSCSTTDVGSLSLTCRRFHALARSPQVLACASVGPALRAKSWQPGTEAWVASCAEAGNADAQYSLGLLRFYCLGDRPGGARLLAQAAMAPHAAALHALAVIEFNGSGGTRQEKHLEAGVALCMRAASLGHVDALRELGHAFSDGYGVPKRVIEGRRLLLEANAREAAAAVVRTGPLSPAGPCTSPGPLVTPQELCASLRGGWRAEGAPEQQGREDTVGALAGAPGQSRAQRVGGGAEPVLPSPVGSLLRGAVAETLEGGPRVLDALEQVTRVMLGAAHLAAQGVTERLTEAGGASSPLGERKSEPRVGAQVGVLLQECMGRMGVPLLSTWAAQVAPCMRPHVAHMFMVDWFALHPPPPGQHLCSHTQCGRAESRRHEFRRCSVCGFVKYCSRACQALDWKVRHKLDCRPVAHWEDADAVDILGEGEADFEPGG